MKINQILNLTEAIRSLVDLDKNRDNDIWLASVVRLKLATNLRRLSKHVQDFTEVRNKLITDLGAPIEGKPGEIEVKESSENYPKFTEELKSLRELDRAVNIEAVTSAELFGKNDQNQIPMDILAVFMDYELLKD